MCRMATWDGNITNVFPKNNKNSSVKKIRTMSPISDGQSMLWCPNSGKLERAGGRPQNHWGRADGKTQQEAYFPRFSKKQVADFDFFFFCGGEGEIFYFWEWFFHSFAHKKLMEDKALFLSRGGGRGEKWPKGKKKRQIPRKMTSVGEGRLKGPWPLRNVHYSSRKANSPSCSGL